MTAAASQQVESVGAGEPAPIIEMRGVSKRYGAVQALKDVSLTVRRGTIHAILGENGAGKSTLIQMLAGNVAPDSGSIAIDGKVVAGSDREKTHRRTVAVVHQHLSLATNVTVAENLFVGKIPARYGIVRWGEFLSRAQMLLDEHNVPARADQVTGNLPLAVQQQVEIVRALSANAQVIALDEPTSSLSVVESRALLRQLAALRESGRTVIVITHHMEDAFALADDATVLRDGQLAGSFPMSSVSEKDVVRMMIGREIAAVPERPAPASGADPSRGLKISGISSGSEVRNATFHAAHGEVVGLYGLVGAGRSELLQTIFGLRARSSGEIALDDRVFLHGHTPQDSIAGGLAFLSEDRISDGLFIGRSIAENISGARMRDFGRWFVNESKLRDTAQEHIRSFQIKGTVRTPVEHLSGGNQQKVLLSRWLSTEPAVLMVDEPTRGVDVATKVHIHKTLRSLAAEGKVVVMASSELPEILAVSDRVYVMAGGRIVDEVAAADATSERLLESASRINRNRVGEDA